MKQGTRQSALMALVLMLALAGAVTTNARRQGAVTGASTVRQAAASRAYKMALNGAKNSERPSILVDPTDRSINDESLMYVDGATPRSMEALIAKAVCAADAVVLGRPLSEQPYLSEEADFVLTEYQVQIETLLRGTAPAVGSTMSYIRPGGKLLVRGRPVVAAHNMYPPLSVGGDYLLFIDLIQGVDAYKVAGDDSRLLDALDFSRSVYPVGPVGNGYRALRNGAPRDAVLSSIASTQCSR